MAKRTYGQPPARKRRQQTAPQHDALEIQIPPLTSFYHFLESADRKDEMNRLLTRYTTPKQHAGLLHVLRYTRMAHDLRSGIPRAARDNRPWFGRAKRFRQKIARLDQEYEALVRAFVETQYPRLRTAGALPDGHSHHVAKTFDILAGLRKLVEADPILTIAPTTRGHQPQPYVQEAIKALRAIGFTKEAADELLRLIGVRPE